MSEAIEAKRDGAKLQKNSGRGQFQKGDARLSVFTIDYKEYAKAFTINRDNWSKLCTDSFRNGNTVPAFKVVLGKESDKVRLAVVPWDILEDYVRLVENERNGVS